MDQGDVEAPNLFSTPVLRKSRQEEMDGEYCVVQGCTDPIKNLQTMKHSHPFAGSIHQIGMDPFFVLYHTPAQLQVFKKFKAGNYLVLCIDATGSLVLKVTTHNEQKSSHIFLYEGVIKAGSEQLPVLQMLSARQDASIIQFWILEYMRQGGPIPSEVVVDKSKALINGIVVTLCGCYNLKDYYNRCFTILVHPEMDHEEVRSFLPLCYLRLDIAHIIGNAAKSKEWKLKSMKRLKLFYMMCLGQLVLETTLKGFRDSFTMVCHVAGSMFLSADVIDSTNKLAQRIQGTSSLIEPLIPSDDEENSEDVDDEFGAISDFDTDEIDMNENFNQFLKDIKQQVKSKCDLVTGGDPNGYYAPTVLEHLYNLLPDFLLWTGIMVSTFQSPTATGSSARVESDFNNLKNGILSRRRRRLRVDKFVAIHLKHVNGACHIASSQELLRNYERTVNNLETNNAETFDRRIGNDESEKTMNSKKRGIQSNQLSSEDSDSDTEVQRRLNASENWRGLAPTPKKSKTSKYMSPCPELAVALESNALQPPKQRLLENGLRRGFSKTGDSSQAQLTNTCSFDVLAQIITSAYIQYGSYRIGLEPHLEGDFF
ncbi:120.7 kDa protein in NOF-FB transposable element [Frankliniella fusca]|uniref:120.7 kDa protein in NOF-FB transposable element n=1 Tax=Frankliniella fusca TaxID=407009 RepID=A0AAE1H8W4_9NEOP|nr:120.7 kDa protein in NOF-FB transposable element [Frankliniella fusca]